MADNQITPFQLTDQFTMDNFNQRINETNTALQNNDPRNWGLGGNAVTLTSGQNLNDIQTSGLYGCYKNAVLTTLLNRPPYGFDSGEVEMLVVPARANTLVQIIHNNYGGITAVRDIRGASAVGEWEYVNPPMISGVEYRTTERYLGKPVYVKAVDCGAMPASTNKSVEHGIENISAIISCTGYFTNGNDPVSLPYARGTVTNVGSIWASKTSIVVWVDNSTYTNCNAYGIIKYNKVTD